MKKMILAFFALLGVFSLSAQSPSDSLHREYTGKYVFPDGSPVKEIGVILENGVLMATSVMGNSELRKTDTKDVYEIVSFAGTATFKRNGDGKISAVQILVQDVDMEGVKVEEKKE